MSSVNKIVWGWWIQINIFSGITQERIPRHIWESFTLGTTAQEHMINIHVSNQSYLVIINDRTNLLRYKYQLCCKDLSLNLTGEEKILIKTPM